MMGLLVMSIYSFQLYISTQFHPAAAGRGPCFAHALSPPPPPPNPLCKNKFPSNATAAVLSTATTTTAAIIMAVFLDRKTSRAFKPQYKPSLEDTYAGDTGMATIN